MSKKNFSCKCESCKNCKSLIFELEYTSVFILVCKKSNKVVNSSKGCKNYKVKRNLI